MLTCSLAYYNMLAHLWPIFTNKIDKAMFSITPHPHTTKKNKKNKKKFELIYMFDEQKIELCVWYENSLVSKYTGMKVSIKQIALRVISLNIVHEI